METMTEPNIIRCACGNLVSEEQKSLARLFPKIIRAYQCDSCEVLAGEDERRRKDVIEQQREQSERESRLDIIPPEMLRTSINHSQFNAGLWVQIENWQPSGLKWLGIVGGAGECKTRCLALLAKRLILAGHRLMWTTAVEFQERVDDTLRGGKPEVKEENRYFSRCKSAGILVIDDFGKNTWNASVERHMFSVIDHRKTHDLPVLWTANTSLLELLRNAGLSADRGAPLIGRMLEASTIKKV